MHELVHRLFQLVFGHLAVADADAGFGNERCQFVPHREDGFHPVVQVEHLPAALQLAQHRLAHQLLAVRPDVGDDRHPFLGRRVDGGDVAHAGQRKVQRAGDRRGGEGEHVHLGAQLLQVFLVRHAEALLLVDDHQPQIVEAHVALEQAVRADQDVHVARGEAARIFSCSAGVRKRESISTFTG